LDRLAIAAVSIPLVQHLEVLKNTLAPQPILPRRRIEVDAVNGGYAVSTCRFNLGHEGFAAARAVPVRLPDVLELMGDVAVDRHRWVLDSLAKRDHRPVHDEG
jgi:hypothetical protein